MEQIKKIMALALALALLGGCGKTAEPPAPAESASPSPVETAPGLSPEEEKAEAERLSAVKEAEEKLEGYRWPRETVQKAIGDREVEFVLHHGNGWTIYVPADWTREFVYDWRSPSGKAGFKVDKWDLPVNNPKWYRAQNGSWRHETSYEPPFDYYYDDDGGYTPPEGDADYIYFFAPAGEKSYEFGLLTIVGMTTDEERAIQEAMLLSFTQDENSHALKDEAYAPGETEWNAAMAGLVAESERIWFHWYHNDKSMEPGGKGRAEYFSYAQALTEFCPGEFTQTFFGERPEGADVLDREMITLCLPEMWMWLYFYEGSPWVCIHHAGEDYWTQVHRADGSGEMVFDVVRAWLEAEYEWADGKPSWFEENPALWEEMNRTDVLQSES